jgi:hypothetical protein
MPRGIRFAAMLSLVLAAFTGWAALTEAVRLAHFYETRELHLEQAPLVSLGDPLVDRRLVESLYSALEPMREPRAVLLGILAVACAFVFVAAGRMLRPDGLPRGGMRQLLSRAAITVAVLRTIDGAQSAVVARRMGQTLVESLNTLPMGKDPLTLEMLRDLLPWFGLGLSVVGTALVAGTFALVGQYFRSEAVREAISAQDGPQEEGE